MMYFYATPYQDYFSGMVPLKKIFNEEPRGEWGVYIDRFKLLKIIMRCACIVAQRSISDGIAGSRWEGDIRDSEIYLFSLPDPSDNRELFGLVWKQSNNGDTFICSPVELPWIEEYKIYQESWITSA